MSTGEKLPVKLYPGARQRNVVFKPFSSLQILGTFKGIRPGRSMIGVMTKNDGFVKSPTSALSFIALSLGRTKSPRLSGPALADYTKFARLEFGAFYFAG
jgi:hypothetical protein